MEATCPSNTTSSPRGFLLFAAFAIIAAGLYLAVATAPARPAAVPAPPAEVIVDDYSHSASDHPKDQPVVRRCLGDKNTIKMDFRTPEPDRFLRTCYDGERVIFQIIDRVGSLLKEKTAYIRMDFRGMADVAHYVDRMGYYRIPGGLK